MRGKSSRKKVSSAKVTVGKGANCDIVVAQSPVQTDRYVNAGVDAACAYGRSFTVGTECVRPRTCAEIRPMLTGRGCGTAKT